jgi:hypothetical protein
MAACIAGLVVQAWIYSKSTLSSMTKHPCIFRPWRALWVLWRVPSSKRLHEIGSTPRRLACHLQCYGLPRHLHGYRRSMYNGWQLGLALADSEASFAGGGRRIKCTRVSTPSAYCSRDFVAQAGEAAVEKCFPHLVVHIVATVLTDEHTHVISLTIDLSLPPPSFPPVHDSEECTFFP